MSKVCQTELYSCAAILTNKPRLSYAHTIIIDCTFHNYREMLFLIKGWSQNIHKTAISTWCNNNMKQFRMKHVQVHIRLNKKCGNTWEFHVVEYNMKNMTVYAD